MSNDLNKNAIDALDRIEKAYINSNKFILNSNDTYEERGFKLQGFERVSSDAKTIRAALEHKPPHIEGLEEALECNNARMSHNRIISSMEIKIHMAAKSYAKMMEARK